ncbi:AraC family transcriptional regulator [Lapillicoccus jejuensis]|uniref:AraC family transcriptional regulator n=1 Tax=Lapillicoccus jejuensis TaxID=402171 RepID=A0A542E4F0_9MICO|nr:AraC family transcriptional regulator [Lapillicoccus jejuensis]TQJ10232.1 AraC family transcriptional regulator [Lapillicoccus jejuensis]
MTERLKVRQDALRAAHQLMDRAPERELVPSDPRQSVRWHEHDYPSPLSRWNYHPELEVHLIRSGVGRFIVGDRVDTFGPGQLVLVGPNLPHHWISDPRDQHIEKRDVVLQFRSDWLVRCQAVLPELDALRGLWSDAARGIEFAGSTAVAAARHVDRVGRTDGATRLQEIFGLFSVMASAPPHERRLLAREWFMPQQDARVADVMENVLGYVTENLSDEIRMSRVASAVGMSESGFSKYFLRASNMRFTDLVRQMRLSHACRLLAATDASVSSISLDVGYTNLSNFNRQFKREYGVTPSEFRARGTR